ncbi:MAG: arylsulfatase [Flavobacteriaceae bacterium]|nr:arylsulfatase [Flavobacteriaceae bacterium]
MLQIKYFIRLLIVVFVSLFLSCELNKTNTYPNIIVILTDDQGWGDLSINGNKDINTPNIDQMTLNGVRFDRFFVSPVCSPTRAEILTGRHHVRTGVYDVSLGGERININEETIADVFKASGYKTAAYGKWHNGMQAPYHPNTRGFEDFYGFCSGHWGNYFNPVLEKNGELVKGKGFIIDDLTNHGIEFMKRNKDNPFFLYLPFNTPHSPMQVPDEFWNKFKDKELTQKGTVSKIPNDISSGINHPKAALAMCENVDWNVGRILETLELLKIDKKTIIVYLSDNGPNGHRWNGGMKGIKGSTDEGGVRSPMIINWKSIIPAGKVVNKIAAAIDLLPTLKDLAGIETQPKNKLDGLSLKKLIFEKNNRWEDRYIYNYWRGRLSIRSQDFRLDTKNNLYDMNKDPKQLKDISSKKIEVFEKMKMAKTKWENEVLINLKTKDNRAFIIGHPELKNTQIPARDAKANGLIKRSNYYPNCSYMTNWVNIEDTITWDAEVAEDGEFEVVVYYTCSKDALGSEIELSLSDSQISSSITKYHDPDEFGKENDRSPRIESYVKDFIPLNMGVISLKKGKGTLILRGLKKKGKELIDFRLLMLKRI